MGLYTESQNINICVWVGGWVVVEVCGYVGG